MKPSDGGTRVAAVMPQKRKAAELDISPGHDDTCMDEEDDEDEDEDESDDDARSDVNEVRCLNVAHGWHCSVVWRDHARTATQLYRNSLLTSTISIGAN